MKQPIRISLGLALMLAIGFFILGTASEVQATSGGCFLPTVAVSALLATAPNDFVSNQRHCKQQCGKIRTTCRRVALAAAKCVTALFKGDRAFDKVGCTDAEDVSDCRHGVRDDFSGAPGFIKEDHAFARDECSAHRESCRGDCDVEL